MNDDEAREFYRQLYNDELDLRRWIDGRARFLLGFLVIGGGAVAKLLAGDAPAGPVAGTVFWIALVVALGALVVGAVFLVIGLWPTVHAYIPRAEDVAEYRTKLSAFHKAKESAPGTTDLEFGNQVAAWLVKAATKNRRSNIRRSGYTYRGFVAVFVGLILLFVAAVPYYVWPPPANSPPALERMNEHAQPSGGSDSDQGTQPGGGGGAPVDNPDAVEVVRPVPPDIEEFRDGSVNVETKNDTGRDSTFVRGVVEDDS